jgi:hypothetical protein
VPGQAYTTSAALGELPCNIEIRDAASLSYAAFRDEFEEKKPVIIRGMSKGGGGGTSSTASPPQSRNKRLREACNRRRLLSEWGDTTVTLATGNTYSLGKAETKLSTYTELMMGVLPLGRHCARFKKNGPGEGALPTADTVAEDGLTNADEVWYHFGDHNHKEWEPLFDLYDFPSKYISEDMDPLVAWGLGGTHSGVPFHFHGHGFGEMIYGRKRWFLTPPDMKPDFRSNVTTLDWATFVLPGLPQEQQPLQCVLSPDEIIYFPGMWWHATLNLDESVFVSSFLAPKPNYNVLGGGGGKSGEL